MGLSEQEQKLLDELERGFYATDANLASKLGEGRVISPKRIIAGAAVAIIGLSLLIVAVMIQVAAFGVIGFLVMLGGLILASSNVSQSIANSKKPSAAKAAKRTGQAKSYFEDRWDRRQGE